jgi:phage terminase large subunit GpA-like protein
MDNAIQPEQKTIELFQRISLSFAPPPPLTVSQWADLHRVISVGSASEPGQWRTSRAPYLREIMDALNDPGVEEIVVMSSSQAGKTECILNAIGYFIACDPTAMLVVQPTLETAQSFSKDRIAPMIRDCPELSARVSDAKAKSSGNTILHKLFPGGYLSMVGANSAAGLAMRPIRVLFCDEVDRYPPSAGAEGDPVKLATARTSNFWNRKIVKASTPTVAGDSRIEADYLLSSKGNWCLPCPSCGEHQPLSFRRLHFETVTMECEHCGSLHSEHEWKRDSMSGGKWIHEDPGCETRGFHLNALASPWTAWEQIIRDFQEAKDNPELLKVFINTKLGETWEERGEEVTEDALEQHISRYGCEVPDKVLFLTAGVDVQEDRLEVEVVGWAAGKESWGVEYVILMGNPWWNDVWKCLDDLLFKTFHYADGRKINISCTCVDSGFCTDEVYAYCVRREQSRVFAVKGKGGFGIPMTDRPNRNNRFKCPLFTIGVDALKDAFSTRLRIKREGAVYCHFPIEEERGYTKDILRGFLAEQKVKELGKNGTYIWRWKKKGGVRNEPLDIRNYATAALEIASPNFEALALRGVAVDQGASTQTSQRRRVISRGVNL